MTKESCDMGNNQRTIGALQTEDRLKAGGFHLVQTTEDGRIMAYHCAARRDGIGGPWAGDRSLADVFSREEAERAAGDWNDYAATKGAPYRFRVEEAG
jgi:hypothetical protein